jgi:signal transduction histidine kinase/CheY-like chemotaxis protein
MRSRLRFGFGFRLFAGFAILAALTVAASVVSVLSFTQFRQGLGRIAEDYVPELIVASRLAEQSQSIVANAPALVVAESQTTRRMVAYRIDDQVAALDEQIAKLRDGGVAADRLQRLVELRGTLVDNLRELDLAVEHRIENERATQALFQRMRRAGARLREVETRWAGSAAPDTAEQREIVRRWIARAEETIELLVECFGLTQSRTIEAARADLAGRLAAARTDLATIAGPARVPVEAVQAELGEIALAAGGVPDTRLARLELNRTIESMLSGNKILADRFVAAVARLLHEIETEIRGTNQDFATVVVRRSNLLLGLSIVCVLSTIGILIYVHRGAVRRLRSLQASMSEHVRGHVAEIDTRGTDELADMARALQFFVAKIDEREAELRASEQRLRSVAANLPGAIFRLVRQPDGGLAVPFISSGVHQLTGLTPEQLIGRPDAAQLLVGAGSRDQFARALERSAAAGTRLYFECSFGDDAAARWVRFLSLPRREADGLTVWDGLMLDSTEWMKAEQAKRAFVSTVSHELRTPLTSIRGSLGLIAGGAVGELPERARRLVELATNNCERLTRLINDILDFEKVESGRMEFTVAPHALEPLLEHAADANRDYGGARRVRIELARPLPAVEVRVDDDRFMQVMSNLLSNAVKYSPDAGVVALGAALVQPGWVRITVRDHGPGIPPAFGARIFERFTQADTSDSRAKGGTGLGLSIAKAIIERLDGRIGFDTTEGAGTTFFCDLPCQAAPARAAPLILVCDDDRGVAALLAEMLEEQGYRSMRAGTAADAERLLAAAQPDALLLDLLLPDRDGLSFLRDLRGRPATAELPIIVVSAHAELVRSEINGGALGVLDWLDKPIDELRFARALAAIRPRDAARPRILHVEDDPDLAVIVATLVGEQVEIINAATRIDAVRLLQDGEFDLVILDLGLPDGSAADLLPLLGALGSGRAPPVLIFSASVPGPEVARQVSDVMTKSLTTNEHLRARIQALLDAKMRPPAPALDTVAQP